MISKNKLFKNVKRCFVIPTASGWQQIGIINNPSDARKLSVRVHPKIPRALCGGIDDNYGADTVYVNGKTYEYRASATGSEWKNLEHGEHGNSYTKIKISRRLR